MGAWFRSYEKKFERALERDRAQGMPEGPACMHPASGGGCALAQPVDARKDIRSLIPPLGLREYWYPALPAKKVSRKPLYWVMLGDELVFFRDEQGEVAALSDVCPHRGASLSQKDNALYPGFITCPYHGATYDGNGECVAFLTEGPDSKMVGQLRARKYPTRTLRGWVFIWMGEGEPAPIEEDVPPELLEDESTVILSTYTYWRTNWMVAIENQNDAHNCFFVHRNSVKQLTGLQAGRNRTPIGPRSKVVNDRAVIALGTNQSYYANDGKMPYQMFYPGVHAVWPLHRWRLLWTWFFKALFRRRGGDRFQTPEEWSSAHHLPCAVRVNYGPYMYTRYAVPVKANMSRQVLFHSARRATAIGRLLEKARFHLYHNWVQNYNFSRQDNEVASPCRYWTPEHLSATDSHLVLLRKLVVERSRDALKRKECHSEPSGEESVPVAADASLRSGS
jgi:phenylpropionate dioxygenase-like ring-hydroxylating dioxygenase large terminal subunit